MAPSLTVTVKTSPTPKGAVSVPLKYGLASLVEAAAAKVPVIAAMSSVPETMLGVAAGASVSTVKLLDSVVPETLPAASTAFALS